MSTEVNHIRELNDALRKSLIGGLAVITRGVAALGAAAVERIVKKIATFGSFATPTIRHEEHDFGSSPAEYTLRSSRFQRKNELEGKRVTRPFSNKTLEAL